MLLCRLIKADWADLTLPKVIEDEFTDEQLQDYNKKGYNVYYLPNSPSEYKSGKPVDGADIDVFNYVFVDCDVKDGVYTKETFIDALTRINIPPTSVVDSGHGIHAYWHISDLDAMSYLRFQRRLMRLLNTDEAISKLFQLMRLPGTINVKQKDNLVPCEVLGSSDAIYTSAELDSLLPPITLEDEQYCKNHYNKTYQIDTPLEYDDTLPPKFGKLLRENKEAAKLYASNTDDRSKSDYRLAHIMFANGFSKEEAIAVLLNTAKATARAPIHRQNYAQNIVDKIWVFDPGAAVSLSQSVSDILQHTTGPLQGNRFPCYKYIDDTEVGFRRGHVMGLVAGAGVGKTAMALNLFLGFVASNPECDHFFCPLEQTNKEIAARWQAMCGDNTRLHSKVHIISNYNDDGTFRDLSLSQIEDYIVKFKQTTGKDVGCVVIDHIGILCNNNKLGQDEGVKQISKAMKGFAVRTNTFLIMQSQTSRSKAGIGDLELDKDAAFGTSVFENFCDYLVTLWQPLKRVYADGAPTIMAYKFCKIRHKNQASDVILEDTPYALYFDPKTQLLRQITEAEEIKFKHYLQSATNKRNNDRKTELVPYISVKWKDEQGDSTTTSSDQKRA